MRGYGKTDNGLLLCRCRFIFIIIFLTLLPAFQKYLSPDSIISRDSGRGSGSNGSNTYPLLPVRHMRVHVCVYIIMYV